MAYTLAKKVVGLDFRGIDFNFTYATWNPADKGADCTLSGGSLVATHGASSVVSGVRSTLGKSTGKWYWEATKTDGTAATVVFGIGKAGSSFQFPGFDANGWSYYAGAGQKINNNVAVAYGAAYGTGDVIGHALDMDTGTVEFFKNGVSQGVAFTGLSGTVFASAASGSGNVNVSQANFGASAFAFSVPSGFNAGLYI